MDSANIAERISHLSPAKRSLLELKLRRNGVDGASSVTIPRRVNRDSAPLSFAQQRLWFINQLEPESSAYNEIMAVRLEGALNINALKGAINAIIERHEVLRTTYVMQDGGFPEQIIGTAQPIDLPVLDISELAEHQRDDEVQRIAEKLKEHPFDLRTDMPLRLALIKLSSLASVLVAVKHHIASDGWSSGVFSRELAALYKSFTQGRPNPFPDLPIQYADYGVWQREWLQGEVLEKQLAYWKEQLQNVPVLELPEDRPRAALQSDRGARQFLNLSKTLSDRLKALSHQQGATLFMTLLAAFQILLQRYTGQDDIAVGSPIAGRTRPETEGLIGFFVNTLVFRNDLSGDPTFREILARVRESALRAYEHQDLPFEKLVEELNPDRGRSDTSFFRVMFALQNAPRRELEMPGLVTTPVEIQSSTSKFDIFAALIERDGQLTLRTEYKTDLFDEATVRRLTEGYQTLLEGIVSAPDRRISELPILDAVERQRLLVGWNDTRRDYPEDKCIHELFGEQAEKNPDAVALIDEDRQLPYRELNRRANQLAHYLKQFGIGPEVVVGICMERSMEMIVGLLAILKAGGAYVPLDPSYPKERLAFMLQDSGAPVLITRQAFVDAFVNHTGKTISLDTDWEKIAQESESELAAETSSDSLAYVIYTSGSTGQPKGVAVPHRAVNRLVINTDYVELTSAHVVAQASNVSFDAATFEIWGALLNGARLVLVAKDILLSPPAMSAAIERHGITTLFLTTALFNQMVQQIPAALGKLQHLLFGGEAVDPTSVKQLLHKGPPKRLMHVYGPTETTTFASWHWVRTLADDATTVPIGRPIANTEIYILDASLNPVPIGVSGELYIGGAGVARGYLNRPELTAAKFVVDPFSNESQARLYRTGDLARYLPDGNIEFVGRIDNQVKIRGFRIELGEIEAVLNQQPMVRECAVSAREDTLGEKRLVAYVVAAPGVTAVAEPLRLSLQERLPEFMVPASFVFIEALPLTPNGKVDRKALPNPESIRRNDDDGYVAPRTAAEKLVAELWAEIVKVDRVGVNDNFFELGGHSLIAVRLAAEMEKRLGCNVPVSLLFKLPTIAQLASELQPHTQAQSSPVIAVRPKGSMPPFFCVHGYAAYRHIARQLGVKWPFYGLGQHFSGRKVGRTRVEDQAKAHLKEIYAIQPRGPYYLAGHSIGGLIAYEMAQLLQNDGEEVAFLGLIDTVFPKHPSASSRRLCCGVVKCWNTLSRLAAENQFDRFIQTVKASAQWRLKAMHCHVYHLIDKRLPPDLLTFYVDEIVFRCKYAKEQRRYQPQPYNGRVDYFRAAQSLNNIEKWKLITNRKLVVHEIPGTHLTMIEEAGAVELARSLKSCLEESAAEPQRLSRHAIYSNETKVAAPAMAFRSALVRR